MIHDNLDPNVTPQSEPAQGERRDEALAEPTDREVPIEAANTPAIIQAWLDGEPVDQSALHAADSYALWSKVQNETSRRRRMHTPTPISGAIMGAIRKEG